MTDKNFIDMSFDEIFPEQPFPEPDKGSPYSSNPLTDDTAAHRKYDPDCDAENHYDDFDLNQYKEAERQTSSTDFTPDAYRYNNQNQDNAYTRLPTISNYITPPTPPKNQHNTALPNNDPQSASTTDMRILICGIISIFFSVFATIGLVISIYGLVTAIREKNKTAKSNQPIKATLRTGIILNTVGLVINLFMFCLMIVP